MDLMEFRSNVAHSNHIFRFRYYSSGWRPSSGKQNILQDLSSYRNTVGHFFHGNSHLSLVNGIIADNNLGIKFFQNEDMHFDNVSLKGHTPEYDQILREIQDLKECDESRIGIELYMFSLLEDDSSAKLTNLKRSNFDLSCDTDFKMATTQMYERRLYTAHDQMRNINFKDDSRSISFCNAMNYGANTIGIHDLNGSFNPNDNEICLRNIRVTTNGGISVMKNMEMVISNGVKEAVVMGDRYEDNENMYINTDISQVTYYGAGLPTGSYTTHFREIATKELSWPGFAYLSYEEPPKTCNGYVNKKYVSLERSESDVAQCSGELLVDGTFEQLSSTPNQSGGWLQYNLYLELVNLPDSYSGHALRAQRKKSGYITYLSQYIDRSCLGGKKPSFFEFSADIRLEDLVNENAVFLL